MLQDSDNLANLDNVTYNTLKVRMILGMNKYEDSLQTTYPDLSDFRAAGGKVLHVHGEQDDSIPAGSSVHFEEYHSRRNSTVPNPNWS